MTRHHRDERGAVLVLMSLALAALMTVAALAVDISVLKADRELDRRATDAAATAAALDLDGSAGSVAAACADAWAFALENMGIDPTTATSPCPATFPASAVCAPTTPVSAVGSAGAVTITITIPVLDTSPLMLATSIGGDLPQALNAADGTPCQRVGVQVSRTRPSIFGGVVRVGSASTTVHSVARYSSGSTAIAVPALVALNKTACPSIEAGSGTIHVYNNGASPGVIQADSLASAAACSYGTTYDSGNSGTIEADAGTTGTAGRLGYSAPSLTGAFGTTGTIIGTRAYSAQVTRAPADSAYHCGNLTPMPSGCTTGASGTDAISAIQGLYGSGTPAGFALFPGSGQSCSSLPSSFSAGNWYINCPSLSVTTTVRFTSGNVVFAGNVNLGSGGNLTINSANTADAIVVVRGTTGLTTSSNTWALNLYRTVMVMTNQACQASIVSCGTISFQNGSGTWTPPQGGPTKGLIYWSETNQATNFQGNPNFSWDGVFFDGGSNFNLQGNARVDASNVQMWVDSVTLNNNSAQLTLKPDPSTGIVVGSSGTALVR